MKPQTFLKSTVVRQWRYVTPKHTAERIRTLPHLCQDSYLECVLEHAEVQKTTAEFAKLHKMPEIADLDEFLRYVDSMEHASIENNSNVV